MGSRRTARLIYVLYDGIENSVFQSQVLFPLKKRLAEDAQLEVTLVTYESKNYTVSQLNNIVALCDRLKVYVLKKIPFFGAISLYYAAYQLKKLRLEMPSAAIARGPWAGHIAYNVYRKNLNVSITVQVRGLAAEEYRYAHQEDLFFIRWLHRIRFFQLYYLEKRLFSFLRITYEVVSSSLKQYLIDNYKVTPMSITIAHYDIPKVIEDAIVKVWRENIRTNVGIPLDAYVYCYNGSYKPWQCVDESIQYVVERYKHNESCFFLILTQDIQAFTQRLQTSSLPRHSYKILSVQPSDVVKYLAAADAGLLLRKPDIINWVSRPTKFLEYRAVGLTVVHNHTVGILAEQQSFFGKGATSIYEKSFANKETFDNR